MFQIPVYLINADVDYRQVLFHPHLFLFTDYLVYQIFDMMECLNTGSTYVALIALQIFNIVLS